MLTQEVEVATSGIINETNFKSSLSIQKQLYNYSGTFFLIGCHLYFLLSVK